MLSLLEVGTLTEDPKSLRHLLGALAEIHFGLLIPSVTVPLDSSGRETDEDGLNFGQHDGSPTRGEWVLH